MKFEEEIAFGSLQQKADEEISLLKAKAEKLRVKKKELMPVWLTGRKRLKM